MMMKLLTAPRLGKHADAMQELQNGLGRKTEMESMKVG